jgi:hypothetical protein
MSWDGVHHQLILFGGAGDGPNGPQYFNQTWMWSGSTWQQLHPLKAPPPLYAAGMTFDPAAGGLVLVAGQGSGAGTFGTYPNTWIWSGSVWSRLQPLRHPSARYFAPAAYDAALRAVIVFGGGGSDGYRDDTWALA